MECKILKLCPEKHGFYYKVQNNILEANKTILHDMWNVSKLFSMNLTKRAELCIFSPLWNTTTSQEMVPFLS